MRSATTTAALQERTVAQSEPRMQLSDREEKLLKIDLSDLALPKLNDMHVDGFKRSWLSRLLG